MKQSNLLPTIVASVAVILAAYFLGDSFKNRTRSNSISVTGLGTKDLVSDLIVWSGDFSQINMD